jgi:hypothetical protein
MKHRQRQPHGGRERDRRERGIVGPDAKTETSAASFIGLVEEPQLMVR